jgi:hypothetical protein
MRANGFKVTEPRKDGARTATRSVFGLTSGVTVDFVVTAPASGDWTLVVTASTGKSATKIDTAAEIASDAVSYAHTFAKS